MVILALSGSVGVGKTTVLIEIHDILEKARIPHGCIDRDALGYSWPSQGRFNEGIIEKNLTCVARTFREAGASRIVIGGVIENSSGVALYRRSIPEAEITVCRLTADLDVRRKRLTSREIGAGLSWHLTRTEELDAIQDESDIAYFTVDNGDRPVREVAEEVLRRAQWPPFEK